MNFDEMSDLDINRKLTQIVKGYSESLMHRNSGVYLDYCNSWADMGPLIADHKLSLEPHASVDTYFSATRHCEFNHQDKNPLRAAAICLIKKLEADNE